MGFDPYKTSIGLQNEGMAITTRTIITNSTTNIRLCFYPSVSSRYSGQTSINRSTVQLSIEFVDGQSIVQLTVELDGEFVHGQY